MKTKEQEMAERNRVLMVRTGSKLYGTDTPESDEDRVAIFMPNEEYILGFQKCEIIDHRKEGIDFSEYSFLKYVKLAMECNPNILESLFVKGENILSIGDIGCNLLAARGLFPSRDLIVQKFKGYAFSQKHKMTMKKENYDELVFFLEHYLNVDDEHLKQKMGEAFPLSGGYREIGDLKLQDNWTLAKCKKIITARLDRVGNRTKGQAGKYDPKFAMNLIRLLFEAVGFLKNGAIEFPFKESELRILKQIRAGEWQLKDILEYSQQLENKIDEAALTTKLPAHPRFDEIQEFTMRIMRKWLNL